MSLNLRPNMDAERILTQLGRTLLVTLGAKLEDGQPLLSADPHLQKLGFFAGPLTLSAPDARSLYEENEGIHSFSLRNRKGITIGYYGWGPRSDGRLPHLLYVIDNAACFPLKHIWVEGKSGNIISVTDPVLLDSQPLTQALTDFL